MRRIVTQEFSGGTWDGRRFEQWEPAEPDFDAIGGRYVRVEEGPCLGPVAQVVARYEWRPARPPSERANG